MPIVVLVLLVLLIPVSVAEIKSVDLEVTTLGEDDWVDDRIQLRPSVTYGLSENVDVQGGVIMRYKTTDQQMMYGVYSRLSWKPGRKKQ